MELEEIKDLVLWMKENDVKSFNLPGVIEVSFRDTETARSSGFVPDHLVITDEEDMFNV